MKIELTNSQRLAVASVLAAYTSEQPAEYIDLTEQPPVVVDIKKELLPLFMEARPNLAQTGEPHGNRSDEREAEGEGKDADQGPST